MAKETISTDSVGVVQAAKFLGLSVQRVKQLAADGRIGVQVAGHWLFPMAELRAFKKIDRPAGRRPKEA